ncbi:MAG: thioredoxin family protein [Candidatus Hydrogenedentes bacterium]|nr:thioredoxin family protein [Candidatus Hydrogenedentota bacterium]
MNMYRKSAILVLACLMAIPALAQFGGPKDIIAVSVVSEQSGAKPGADLRVAVVAAIKEPYHVNANKPLEQFLIPTALTLEPPQGVTVIEIVYPEAENKNFSFSPDKPVAVYEGEVLIGVVLRVDASVAPGPVTVPGKLRYQACNDTQCLAPTTVAADVAITVLGPGETAVPSDSDVFARIAFGSGTQPAGAAQKPTGEPAAVVSESSIDPKDLLSAFSIAGQTGGYLNAGEFIAFVDASERGEGFSQSTFFAGKSLAAIVVLTLLGGLALNLTPCVLPLIPINLAIIGAGAKAGSRAKGFTLGGLYGLGIALVYGVLGLIAVLGAGTFGTINASPWFNFAIAIIFVVLALAMFDIILIDFSKFQSKLGIKKEKGSFIFAFLMGSVNALLAGACVAPVVIAVILYAQDAYAGGSPAGLALPFLLGVGMALPWPFAGAGLALLPKPGMWMVRVKQAFGVFILGFAAYYGYLGYTLFSERYLVDPAAVTASAENLAEEGWLTSLEEGLAQAKRENKPVLIDFWATWCKNCLVMNETTFQDPAVLERLKDFVKIKYQAEQPEEAPAKDVLAQFEYVGLPLYVVLKP